MSLLQSQLTAAQTADLAVVLVRAEGRVGPAQPVEHLIDGSLVGILAAEIEHDRHAHDVLDAAKARNGDGERAHARFAFKIADCSELTKASLVSVAPETRSMFALWALRASLRRIGNAFALMKAERLLSFG